MPSISSRVKGLVDELTESGDLTPQWRSAFLTVQRHQFIPGTVWAEVGDSLMPAHAVDDWEAWLDICYANEIVITQVDDGTPVGPGQVGREITSSASRPNVVALMLAALDAEPGMTVLEIGTGTGYNAALLAERLGAENVTTIEVDPFVAQQAQWGLDVSRTKVRVITGDGALGHPPNAPYDRVIATAAVQRVPYAWVEQTRPGGRVLVPWATDFHNGALLSLAVGPDGTATGRIVGNVAFMMLRNQRTRRATVEDDVRNLYQARKSATDTHPYRVIGEYDASLAVGLRVPDCKKIVQIHDVDDDYTLWLIDQRTQSWASLRHHPHDQTYEVKQQGERNLWEEVEAAHNWWVDLGKPGTDRWGVTVTRHDQQVWLDSPGNPIQHV